MNFEEALEFVEAALKAKTCQQLSEPEKQILKAAWLDETYNSLADSLYLSVGHIKDLAYPLWHRVSDVIDKKVTKHNFRYLMEKYVIDTDPSERMVENVNYEAESNKGNILIIDDLIESLHFLTGILVKQGYKVRSVTNGKMALRTIVSKPPDIILLDIKMPDMDGYEICKIIKADEDISEIPIIFLSAINEVVDRVRAFEVGGADYITKPFYPQEVIARIETQITIQKQKLYLQQEIQQHQQTAC